MSEINNIHFAISAIQMSLISNIQKCLKDKCPTCMAYQDVIEMLEDAVTAPHLLINAIDRLRDHLNTPLPPCGLA